MAGRLFSHYVSRTLLEFSSGARCVRNRGTHRNYWTTLRRTGTALTSGRAAFLLGVPTLSCLGYEAYLSLQTSTVVYALEQGDVLEQADYLFRYGHTEKAYQLLLPYTDSGDVQFLWRLAKATRDLSVMPDINAEQKKKLTFEAFGYAKKALELDEKCFAAHKWYAVCLGDVGDYEGVKVKVGNSYIIRKHLERAVELNPKDATCLYILGCWCFSVAELPWYQRKVAAVIFSAPPTSTYEEALDFFLKAEEVDPNSFSKNLMMLGKTYLVMKNKEQALLWLTKAKEYPALTQEDKEANEEAANLLKKLG